MVEKFSDFEGGNFIDVEGTFVFKVVEADLKDSKNGNLMVVLDVQAPEGKTTLYHVLSKNTRWSYNKLIAACLKLTPEEKAKFELDYETVHQQLIGKSFVGIVEAQSYDKETKVLQPDGTYLNDTETKTSYKIVEYLPVE